MLLALLLVTLAMIFGFGYQKIMTTTKAFYKLLNGCPKNLTWKQKWLWELRHGNWKQFHQGFYDPEDMNCVCAMGIVRQHFENGNEHIWELNHLNNLPPTPEQLISIKKYRDIASPNSDLFQWIMHWNDNERLNFRQIADKLERTPGF